MQCLLHRCKRAREAAEVAINNEFDEANGLDAIDDTDNTHAYDEPE